MDQQPTNRILAHHAALCAPVVWLALPGLVALPFIGWQSPLLAVCFLVLWVLMEIWMLRRWGALQIIWNRQFITLSIGYRFSRRQCLPWTGVGQMTLLTTPLLRRFDACALLISAPGTVMFLPAVRRQDAEFLQQLLEEENAP